MENKNFKNMEENESDIEMSKIELACAPMLKVTTPTFRYLLRLISKKVILYTEMIVANTVVHVTDEKLDILLGKPEENTVVQMGGSDKYMMAEAIKRLLKMGFKTFNLNCGCPSDRVQAGMFGAILMLHKELVADMINYVHEQTGVILTLKTRIGVDEEDSYEFFKGFIEHIVRNTKCRIFYVHARKCWLKGLNPKKNRNIPPLTYDYVYKIKEEFPDCFIGINGGIKLKNAWKVKNCDGIMIGREAWNYIEVFNKIWNVESNLKDAMKKYLEWASSTNFSLSKVIQPIISIRKNKGNNKKYKQRINEIFQDKTPIKDVYARIEEFFDEIDK